MKNIYIKIAMGDIMKNCLFIELCFLAVLLLTGCGNSKNYSLIIDDKFINEKNYVEICELSSDRRVYSQFNEIKFVDHDKHDKTINLAEALKKGKVTIDDIISKMELVSSMNDGGSNIYKYRTENGNLSNSDFFVAKCDVINGNKNVIFGNSIDVGMKCTSNK